MREGPEIYFKMKGGWQTPSSGNKQPSYKKYFKQSESSRQKQV